MVEEIAVETGVTPESAEKLAYKFAARTGWFNPTPELIEDATRKLGEVLVCEARLREGHTREDGGSNDGFSYEEENKQILEEAKLFRYQKEHPEIFATIDKEGYFVSWSPKALQYLRRNYKPKDYPGPSLYAFKFG